ncbi:MAG: hypothetical protein V4527_10615 [Pseudomonadota bacterium]
MSSQLLAMAAAFPMLFSVPATASAEIWHCQLSVEQELPATAFDFEIIGSELVRSPDDMSGERLRFKITHNSGHRISAVLTEAQSNRRIVVQIDKMKRAGSMTGGNWKGGGYRDKWQGPCRSD